MWGRNRGGGEAEVGVVGEDLLVDLRVVAGDRWERRGQRDVRVGDVFRGEEAALEVVVGGGLEGVVVGADEVDASVVESDRNVGIVGDDDADGQETVVGVVEAGVGFGVLDVAGFGGDGDVVVRGTVVAGILGGRERGFGRARLVGVQRDGDCKRQDGRDQETTHGFDYPLTI